MSKISGKQKDRVSRMFAAFRHPVVERLTGEAKARSMARRARMIDAGHDSEPATPWSYVVTKMAPAIGQDARDVRGTLVQRRRFDTSSVARRRNERMVNRWAREGQNHGY